ncbi:hypothetical protein EYF80_012524 [Liparis tanakae]|uniref:Uncharacterized protein n=1 Tax=Liparis tanakae TaxID=230148 RepID=A0A4Z2IHD8_9TELE|nr:hypothetical protein EYF80_012524 [Liparis tanakae]
MPLYPEAPPTPRPLPPRQEQWFHRRDVLRGSALETVKWEEPQLEVPVGSALETVKWEEPQLEVPVGSVTCETAVPPV